MYRLKNYIAFVLLLVFVRVLVPETTVLALHAHEHTKEVQKKTDTGFRLDKKHAHCHTDNLFNSPFSPASLAAIISPLLTFPDTYSVSHGFVWKFTFPNNTELRGPPVA
ncbi:hypothetical protein [Adhaeribacter aquaticus]|uniref:hypothetical protein n=1 Tax=Adhaeribacter aquaticus TaxID=299567 RepID=UPI0003F7D307|nr:hypothetical protein [Adhaeribacter aquaticus]